MKQAVLFWSGGKDSALALYHAQQDPGIEIKAIITTLNQQYRRISMHGISEAILDRQVEQLGVPLIKMWVPNEPANNTYEEVLLNICRQLTLDGIDTVIFGDIFLEDLRQYRENLLKPLGLACYFPLWKRPTYQLINEFISLGFQTITCCISTAMLDNSWIGKQIDERFLKELPEGVDSCGENGEFHTFCFAGPIFKKTISYQSGEVIFKPLMIKSGQEEDETGFLFLDIF